MATKNETKAATVTAKLQQVQRNLIAPKSKFNAFGKYNYRSVESIYEAVKPLLAEVGADITVTDDIIEIGGRIYIKSLATFVCDEGCVSVTGFARESDSRAGMDAAQVTGSSSSYARKYALGGLLLIDDNKDIDSLDNSTAHHPAPKAEPAKRDYSLFAAKMHQCKSVQELAGVWAAMSGDAKRELESLKNEIKVKLTNK